jgi:hypothetical protein
LLDARSVVLVRAREGGDLLSGGHGRHADGAIDGEVGGEDSLRISSESVLGDLLLLDSLVQKEEHLVVLGSQLAVLKIQEGLDSEAAGDVAFTTRAAKSLLQITLLLRLDATFVGLPVDWGGSAALLVKGVLELALLGSCDLGSQAMSNAAVGEKLLLLVILGGTERDGGSTFGAAFKLEGASGDALHLVIVEIIVPAIIVPAVVVLVNGDRVVINLLLLISSNGDDRGRSSNLLGGLRGIDVGCRSSSRGSRGGLFLLPVNNLLNQSRDGLGEGKVDGNLGGDLLDGLLKEGSQSGKGARSGEKRGRRAAKAVGGGGLSLLWDDNGKVGRQGQDGGHGCGNLVDQGLMCVKKGIGR